MAMNVSGVEESYLESFSLKNIYISCESSGRINFTRDWTFKNVTINSLNGDDMTSKQNINLVARKSDL